MNRCGGGVWERLERISWDIRQEGWAELIDFVRGYRDARGCGEHKYGRILWQVRLKRLTPHAVIVTATEFTV